MGLVAEKQLRLWEEEESEHFEDDLTVPYALDRRCSPPRTTRPREATKSQPYECPECGGRVFRRRSHRGRLHFAHKRGESQCPLVGESPEHCKAKHLVVLAVTEWRERNARAPSFEITFGCGHKISQPIPSSIRRGIPEKRIDKGHGRFQPDVVLKNDGDEPEMGIEIRHSHAVSEDKAERFGRTVVLELAAEDVIADHRSWRAIACWNVGGEECDGCVAKRVEAERVAAEAAAAREATKAAKSAKREFPARRKAVAPNPLPALPNWDARQLAWQIRAAFRPDPEPGPLPIKVEFINRTKVARVYDCPARRQRTKRGHNFADPVADCDECAGQVERRARVVICDWLGKYRGHR